MRMVGLFITVMLLYIMYMPKELPQSTFNISVDGETRYYAQMPAVECARHITTVRETLLLTFTLIEVNEILSQKIVEAQCLRQELIPTRE